MQRNLWMFTLAILFMAPSLVVAVPIDWIGGTGGTFQWNTATNWNPNTVPNSPTAEVAIVNAATVNGQSLTLNLGGLSYNLLSLSATSNTSFVNTRIRLQSGTLNFADGNTLSFAGNDQPNQELFIANSVNVNFTTLNINGFRTDRAGRQRGNWSRGLSFQDVGDFNGDTLNIEAGTVRIAGGGTNSFNEILLDPFSGNLLFDSVDLTGVNVIFNGSAPSDVNDRSGISGESIVEALQINGENVLAGTYDISNAATAPLLGGGTIDLTNYMNFGVIGAVGAETLTINGVIPEPASLLLLGGGLVLMLSRRCI